MSKISLADILNLPLEERIRLVEESWESIVAVPEAISLNEDQAEELERTLEAYYRDPRSGSPWEEIKSRVRN